MTRQLLEAWREILLACALMALLASAHVDNHKKLQAHVECELGLALASCDWLEEVQ